MTSTNFSKLKDPYVLGVLSAMRRAAAEARRIAIETNTHIVRVEDGKIRLISAEELRRAEATNNGEGPT